MAHLDVSVMQVPSCFLTFAGVTFLYFVVPLLQALSYLVPLFLQVISTLTFLLKTFWVYFSCTIVKQVTREIMVLVAEYL